jgi:hypothetical protein
MNKRRRKDSYQSGYSAGVDAEVKEFGTVNYLNYFYKPYQKQDNGRRNEAQDEPFVFDVFV